MTRRIALALLVAGSVGYAAIFMVAAKARTHEYHQAQLQRAMAQGAMLADLAGRAAASGSTLSQLQQTIERFDLAEDSIAAVKIIQGRRLEVSTAASDTGQTAAPRSLKRDEKELFDRAALLAAAVKGNLDGSGPTKDEIIIEPDGGGITLSLPINVGDDSGGMIELTTPPLEDPAPMPWWLLALAVVLLVATGSAIAHMASKRPAIAITATSILLLLGLVLMARIASAPVAAAVEAAASNLATTISEAEHFATDALTQLRATQLRATQPPEPSAEPGTASGTAPSIASFSWDSSKWDVDARRDPRGFIGPGGTVVASRLAEEVASRHQLLSKISLAVAVVSLAIFLVIGLGVATRLWSTLVRFREAYAYTAPALIAMLLLVFFPFFYGIALSFTNQNVYNTDKPLWETWIGVDNFVDILTDLDVVQQTDEGLEIDYSNFYWTLGFTIVWTIANVTIGVSVGLLLALILNTPGLRFRTLYRVLLILPWAVPNYITALIWKGMFHSEFGVVNQVVQMLGGDKIAWFERPLTSFITVLATNGWLSFPFMMVICLGALQSISSDLYEAARVDGANRWQQFRGITLPSLKPALVPAVILSVVWTFNMFNIIYLVSQGEPAGATEILVTEAYKLAFEQYRYGYAAAYSTVIFGILLIYGVWQNRVTRATEGI